MQVRVRILDNLNLGAMWKGYGPGDRLRCVYELDFDAQVQHFATVKDAMYAVAENMFIKFNRDDRPNGHYAKSMSVGDVVEISYGDGRIFLACDKLGFVEVDGVGDDVAFDDHVPTAEELHETTHRW